MLKSRDWRPGSREFGGILYLLSAVAALVFAAGLFYLMGWVTPSMAARASLMVCGPYFLLAPVVWYLAKRFPLKQSQWLRRIWIHLGSALVFMLLCESIHAVVFLLNPPPGLERGWQDVPETTSQSRLPFPGFSLSPLSPHFLPPQRIPAGRFAPSLANGFPRPPMPPLFLPTKALFSIAIYWLIVCLSHLTRYSVRLQQREQQQAILQAEITQARLESLQMQLQPHFLFNTLNTISALIPDQPQAADEMIGNLCDLLRLTLDQKELPETPLREELHLLGLYLEIQLVRFNGRLRIAQQVEPEIMDALVPTFVLQPLVENAIKHGVGHEAQEILISLHARRFKDRLQIEVSDTGCGASTDMPNASSNGIGLGNTRMRLRALYGVNQRFEIRGREPHGVCVELEIPLHRAPMKLTAVPDCVECYHDEGITGG